MNQFQRFLIKNFKFFRKRHIDNCIKDAADFERHYYSMLKRHPISGLYTDESSKIAQFLRKEATWWSNL